MEVFGFLSVVIVIFLFIVYEFKEIEEKRKKTAEDQLRFKYPDGYDYYKYNHDKSVLYRQLTEKYRSTDEILELKYKIIDKQEEENARRRKNVESIKKFIEKQDSFSKDCSIFAHVLLHGFGKCVHTIPEVVRVDYLHSEQYEIKIWQFFASSLCLNPKLDYSLLADCKSNLENLSKLSSGTIDLKQVFYDNINDFIKFFPTNSFVGIMLNLDNPHLDKDVLSNYYAKITSDRPNIKFFSYESKYDSIPNDIEYLIVIDVYTENSELINKCKRLLHNKPHILYISLCKCFDNDEMQELINNKKSVLLSIYKKRKLGVSTITEQQRALELIWGTGSYMEPEKDIRKIEFEKLVEEGKIYTNFVPKVRYWKTIRGDLYYNYLLNYYPTTCAFEANDSEWKDRWTVWNFKNTPGKISIQAHQNALNDVIPRVKSMLESTFGASYLQYLTLVCIPASTAEKTKARYEEFADRLCQETGMINAYTHMLVIKDSEEKKLGGNGISTDNISFDEDFFKRKNVILFDDVITKGESMLRFQSKMKLLKANVICGITIGKTKHERS